MKIRSSKQLKESMQNLDKVMENDSVETVAAVDPIMAAAYDESKKTQEAVTEILDELGKAAEDVVEEAPEAPMSVKNGYTTQLKLDEALEDFRIDGRSHPEATRGEDEGDRYLDYDMYEFVSELLCGKNCNTNPAPITPIVWRRDPKDDKFKYMEMKKFMTQGEDSVSYEGENEAGALDLEYDEEDIDLVNSTDTEGMYKGAGSPQVGFEDDGFRVYSSNLEDLQQAQQGVAHYGLKYGQPTPRLNKRSHWKYSMKVYIPMDREGNFLTLTDWLSKTGRSIEDVMRPDFVKTYNKKLAKLQQQEDEGLIKDIVDAYVQKSRNNPEIDIETLVADLFDELEGLPYDKNTVEKKLRATRRSLPKSSKATN